MAEKRERWGGRLPFIMAAIGSAVGLGNVWRFPATAYANGGGAFLIPYFVALITAGIPLMIVEYAIGQKFQRGAPGALAALNPRFRWVGWLALLVASIITFYYVVIMAWACHYSIASVTLEWTRPAPVRVEDPIGKKEKVIPPDRVILYLEYTGEAHKKALEEALGKETVGSKVLLLSAKELKERQDAEARKPEAERKRYVSLDDNAGHYFFQVCLGGYAEGQWRKYRTENSRIEATVAALKQEKQALAAAGARPADARTKRIAEIDREIEQLSSKRISYRGEMFGLKTETAIWCGVVWFVIFLIIFKGVRVVGKVVMWTVSVPVVLLAILLIRGITLPGATKGILFYLTPSWDALMNPQVWLAAYGQIFFSLSLGFGVLIAYASYMPRDSDVTNNAFITSFANCATSFFAAFAVFSVLGYLAQINHAEVGSVVKGGPGLVFITYPIAIAKIGGVWARVIGVIFFVCLLLLGIDSAFSLVEGVLTGLSDRFGKINKALATGLFCGLAFLCSLFFATRSGLMWLDIVDNWMSNYGLVAVGLLECVAVAYFFRHHELEDFVNERSEIHLGGWFELFIKYVTPAVLVFLLGARFISDMQKTYGGYDGVLPGAVNLGGWGVFILILGLALALGRNWTALSWLVAAVLVFAGFYFWFRLRLGTAEEIRPEVIPQAAFMAGVGAVLLFGGFLTCLRIALRNRKPLHTPGDHV